MGIDIKRRVANEMSLLSNELQVLHTDIRDDETSKRYAYVNGQLQSWLRLMEALLVRDDDWAWFPAYLELHRKQALPEYKKAKAEDNHTVAIPILGHLRFIATLARRIADPRRPMLFRSETPWSAASEEEDHWHRELTLLLGQATANFQRVEPLGNEPRRLMALAQVYLGNEMTKQFLQVGDCSGFKESVYDYIDSETERYHSARFADDRESARVMLARVRFAKTLARRLDTPQREDQVAYYGEPSLTRH